MTRGPGTWSVPRGKTGENLVEATKNDRIILVTDVKKVGDQENWTMQRAEVEKGENLVEATSNDREMERIEAEKLGDQATWRSCVPRLPLG